MVADPTVETPVALSPAEELRGRYFMQGGLKIPNNATGTCT